MSKHQILVVVGSLRRDSLNRKLANQLPALAGADAELTFTQARLDDLPLYNQDDDANPAESVRRWKREIAAAHGLIFVTPEYNRSLSGVLKNALDHASRPYGQNVLAGKPAGVIGVSVGTSGTAMAQQHLRNILAYLDAPTMGQPEAFLQAKEGFFDGQGGIANADSRAFLQKWVSAYATWVRRWSGARNLA